jgi:Holliday junction resolvase RusA-like endonuclease
VFVSGVPVPQGSKRRGAHGQLIEAAGRRHRAWRDQLAWSFVAQGWHKTPIDTGPVGVVLAFFMPRPAGHYLGKQLRPSAPRWHTRPADIDKLSRAVLDALTEAGVLGDDAQVTLLTASKVWASTEPGVHVQVEELAE